MLYHEHPWVGDTNSFYKQLQLDNFVYKIMVCQIKHGLHLRIMHVFMHAKYTLTKWKLSQF